MILQDMLLMQHQKLITENGNINVQDLVVTIGRHIRAFELILERNMSLSEYQQIPTTYRPQTQDLEQAEQWLDAAKRAMSIIGTQMVPGPYREKHISRVFSSLNRIRPIVNRLRKQLAQATSGSVSTEDEELFNSELDSLFTDMENAYDSYDDEFDDLDPISDPSIPVGSNNSSLSWEDEERVIRHAKRMARECNDKPAYTRKYVGESVLPKFLQYLQE